MSDLPAPGLTVVVPAFNEEDAVGEVIEQLRASLDAVDAEYEILLVDDGSTDATSDHGRLAGSAVISLPANMGYGSALRRGILAARFDRVLICDADGTYPVDMAGRLWELSEFFDMVVAQRTGAHFLGPWYRRPLRYSLGRMSSFLAGRTVPDVNSGFRVFQRQLAIRYFGILSSGFSFTTGLTLAMMLEGFSVHFVPVSYATRVGNSKVKLVRDAIRMLQVLVRTAARYNPLKLILIPSTFTMALSLAALGYWIASGNPTALVVATILFVGSLLVFSIGLVAEAANGGPTDDTYRRDGDRLDI